MMARPTTAVSAKSQAVTGQPTDGVLSSKVCGLLDAWRPGEMVPRYIDRPLLIRAQFDATRHLRPASDEAFGVIMDRLFDFAETFGIKHHDQAAAMRFYSEALDDLPADLLDLAVNAMIRGYVYGNRLPPPGDLRNVASEELAARHHKHYRLGCALVGRLEAELPPPPSQQERDRVAAKFSALVARLRVGNHEI